MAKNIEFTDLYTHRKMSIFPEEVQKNIGALGISLTDGTLTDQQINQLRDSFADIPATSIAKASEEIRDIAKLYRLTSLERPPFSLSDKIRSSWQRRPNIFNQLEKHTDLGWLLLFHGDGYVREKALATIKSEPQSEFEFATIVYRLNDWVENVRLAANNYADLHFPHTSSSIIANSAFYFLSQAKFLARWDSEGRVKLNSAIFRHDVLLTLKNEFLKIRSGRVGYVLRQLLKCPEFDDYLETLANDALLPIVRAVAIESLIMNTAKWPVGYKRNWIDKVHGKSERVRVFEKRQIKHSLNITKLISKAATDRSAHVRKVAMDALISMLKSSNSEIDQIAEKLSNDKSPAVRSRAEFYLNNKRE